MKLLRWRSLGQAVVCAYLGVALSAGALSAAHRGPGVLNAQHRAAPEYDLKAAFLAKFPQFVAWPAAALGGPTVDICVAQPSPFGTALRDLAAGETVTGKRVTVRTINSPAELGGCHVLFIPADAVEGRHVYLAAARKFPILTVSDAPNFTADGGMLYLRIIDSRVRFEANADAATRAGLRLDSQLLRIAVRVHGEAR